MTGTRMLVVAARCVPGDQWIRERNVRVLSWLDGAPVVREQLWWADCLHRLHSELWSQALWAGPVLRRTVRLDEAGRAVTLFLETDARRPDASGWSWGLPPAVLHGPPPRCPLAGDALVVPGWPGPPA